jgi:hypothetical protein
MADNLVQEDAVFNCDNVDQCFITCSGPDKTIIKSVTKDCGCYIEWGFNAGFFRFAVAIVIYILLNVSRCEWTNHRESGLTVGLRLQGFS